MSALEGYENTENSQTRDTEPYALKHEQEIHERPRLVEPLLDSVPGLLLPIVDWLVT